MRLDGYIHGRTVTVHPQSRARLLAACWSGREPAELLTRKERELLLFELWARGLDDVEIAIHMRQSTYTTCRIRERLGLQVRRPSEGAAA
jgi:hypothetical protein